MPDLPDSEKDTSEESHSASVEPEDQSLHSQSTHLAGATQSNSHIESLVAQNIRSETLVEDSETHRYTSRLYEYGAQAGMEPQYSKVQISSYPSRWRCCVQFVGLNAEAEGRSYKEARHNASAKMYRLLKLKA